MYAITELDLTRDADVEFQDGSYFTGTVCIGVEWDGDWKIQWAEGLLIDANDNELEFTSDTGVAQNVMRQLNNEIAFRRRATDWAEEAIAEHKADIAYWGR